MKLYNATEVMLCWVPDTDIVKLAPWPDPYGETRGMYTHLACNSEIHEMSFQERKMMVFIEAMHLIINYNIPPQSVHNCLMGLEEYVDGCADDMPGVAKLRRSLEID